MHLGIITPAVDRLKKKFISFVCGTRQTGMKLYKGLNKS